jgi:HSP20 family protein
MLIPTSSRWAWPTRNLAADVESGLIGDVIEDFDRMVDSFLRPTYANSLNFPPSCDVNETENHYMVSFDMPGVKKEDVKIELRSNQLRVSGERRHEARSGRSYGKFERTFTLPATINADKIEAHYEDGVLSIALPKAESAKPKNIEIQTGNVGFFNKLLSPKKESSKELKDVKVS